MADPDRTALTDTLEDAAANTGVPTVRLEGRVASQTGPTWCVAIPGATTTTTDRNAHTDAETRCTVEYTTLANYPTPVEDQGGELDSLRSLRNIARAEFKTILVDVARITTPLPAVYKLENSLENLQREQANLRNVDSAIIDLVDEELEEEVEQADLYTLCFFHAKALLDHYITYRKRRAPPEIEPPDSRLQELISNLEDHSANSHTRVSEAILTDTKTALPYQPSQQEPVTGDSENLSSTAELSETQTEPVESNAPDEPSLEPPPYEFEYISVPDFMKGEAMP